MYQIRHNYMGRNMELNIHSVNGRISDLIEWTVTTPKTCCSVQTKIM